MVFLLYSILAFMVIFILVDTVEMMDKFIDSNMRPSYIVYYYAFYLPYIITLTIPVAMLLASLFSMGRLMGDNEITAMKASGQSLYRLLMPLYGFAILVSVLMMVFAEAVVPRTNMFREDIKDLTKIKDPNIDKTISFSFARSREMDRQNVFLSNDDGRIVYAKYYRSKFRRADGVSILLPAELPNTGIGETGTHAGFSQRIDADSLTYHGGAWYLHGANERRFNETGEELHHHDMMKASFITLEPSDFARIDIKPEEMNYIELAEFIEQVGARGGDASEWMVDLYMKIAFPLASFVIVFFGAPLAAGSPMRGKTASFGIALMICFTYYMLINTFQILGRSGAIQPLLAAWLSNAIFFCVGIVMHLRASK